MLHSLPCLLVVNPRVDVGLYRCLRAPVFTLQISRRGSKNAASCEQQQGLLGCSLAFMLQKSMVLMVLPHKLQKQCGSRCRGESILLLPLNAGVKLLPATDVDGRFVFDASSPPRRLHVLLLAYDVVMGVSGDVINTAGDPNSPRQTCHGRMTCLAANRQSWQNDMPGSKPPVML